MKKGFVVSFTCLTLLGVGWHANSITASTPDEIVIKQREQNSKAWLNWSGSTYLTAGQWCNVIGDNNLFKADVNVTNNGGNPGSIKVQILNNKGEIKGKSRGNPRRLSREKQLLLQKFQQIAEHLLFKPKQKLLEPIP